MRSSGLPLQRRLEQRGGGADGVETDARLRRHDADAPAVDGERRILRAASRRGLPRLTSQASAAGPPIFRAVRPPAGSSSSCAIRRGCSSQRVLPSWRRTGADSATRAWRAAPASAAARTRGCCTRSGSSTRAEVAVDRGERADEHALGRMAVQHEPGARRDDDDVQRRGGRPQRPAGRGSPCRRAARACTRARRSGRASAASRRRRTPGRRGAGSRGSGRSRRPGAEPRRPRPSSRARRRARRAGSRSAARRRRRSTGRFATAAERFSSRARAAEAWRPPTSTPSIVTPFARVVGEPAKTSPRTIAVATTESSRKSRRRRTAPE